MMYRGPLVVCRVMELSVPHLEWSSWQVRRLGPHVGPMMNIRPPMRTMAFCRLRLVVGSEVP